MSAILSASASASVLPAVGDAGESMAPLSLPSLIAALRAGTPADMADILAALDHGMALWAERKGVPVEAAAAAVEKSKPVKSKKAAKKEPAAPAPLPEAGEDGAPDAAAYRLDPSAINESTCLGRAFSDQDKRWKPAVLRESQCGKAVVEGSDLCATCTARLAKYAADPKPGPWTGRITEEPLEWVHMLGTKWAADKAPKWLGVAGSAASDSGSVSGGSEAEMPAAAPAPAAPKKAAAEKETAKAAKTAEKEAAKAAKTAEKEAAAAAKKAEKEAAAAAKKAEKEAAAAAKKAEKEAEKATKKAEKPAKKAAPAVTAAVPAKADTGAAVADTKGELKFIDGSMYMVRNNGNVYEYNELEEAAGDFVGRLGADGESIDLDAEEVTGEESDSE